MGRAARSALVFSNSRDAFGEIETAHDLFWCAAVSMWNARTELERMQQFAPQIDERSLGALLAAGSGMNGSNVVTANRRFTWEQQLEELAWLRLLQLTAHYEGWLETLANALISSRQRRGWVKKMTFPRTVGTALSSMGTSSPMRDLFTHSVPHSYRIDSTLAEATTCFRYFKEVRNCAVHSGRRASSALIAAQKDYEAVVASGALQSTFEPPEHVSVQAVGDRVAVSHFGVIGLSGLVQRLIVTVDAFAAMTPAGEAHYLQHWLSENGAGKSLSANPAKRSAQLGRMAGRVGPKPTRSAAIWDSMLKRHGLIRH